MESCLEERIVLFATKRSTRLMQKFFKSVTKTLFQQLFTGLGVATIITSNLNTILCINHERGTLITDYFVDSNLEIFLSPTQH